EMRKNPGRGPIGWVQIFLQTKKGLIYDEGSNLVSARGREFVAQRTFNITNYNGGLRTDWRNPCKARSAIRNTALIARPHRIAASEYVSGRPGLPVRSVECQFS
ncbi:MAG: hypothetical protein WCG14_06185, partial [Chlamydiia bacterium]